MPSYRGVSKEELICSVNEVLELLETHSIGPECQKEIDKLRTADDTGTSALGRLAAAETDRELVEAISSVHGLLVLLGGVLEYHAEHNTDGKGMDIWDRLGDWGGVGGARMLAYYPIDGESDVWLLLRRIESAALTKDTLKKMEDVVSAESANGRKDQAVLAAQAVVDIYNMVFGDTAVTGEELRAPFEALDLGARNIAGKLAEALQPPAPEKPKPQKKSPIDTYGIQLPDGFNLDYRQSPMKELMTAVEKVVNPYMEINEVMALGCGFIGEIKDGRKGVMLWCTKRVAQVLADAFPNEKVIDKDGNVIASSIPARPKKLNFDF